MTDSRESGLLANRVALVSGAGSPAGRATALAMAREGAVVVLSDRNAEGGEETLEILKARGGDGRFVPADLTRAEDANRLVERAVEAYGRLDCAWNNAGSYRESFSGRLHVCPEDTLDRWMDLHLQSIRLCLRYEIPRMLEQGGGTIVNTAAVHDPAGSGVPAAAVASRHAVAGLTRAAALDYAKRGIRVNAVFPSLAGSEARPAGARPPEMHGRRPGAPRLETPDEAAELVVWLCSESASLVTGLVVGMERGFLDGLES